MNLLASNIVRVVYMPSIECMFYQAVEPTEVYHKTDLAYPHTVHCIPGGKIMISCIGDPAGNGKGNVRFWSIWYNIYELQLKYFSILDVTGIK